MFYLGVHIKEQGASVVVVEKEYFSGKRRYHVSHTTTIEEPEDGITKKLLEMRLDRRWTAVKKVFSQSGRPPRKKEEPPLILLSSFDDGLHMAEALRRCCASVEVMVRNHPDQNFLKRLNASAFDNCHVVDGLMVFKAMGKALKKGCLDHGAMVAPSCPQLHPISDALALFPSEMPSFNGTTPWFYAFGNCIWHGESIRRIKRY